MGNQETSCLVVEQEEDVVLLDQLELLEIPALVEIVEGLIPGVSLPNAH